MSYVHNTTTVATTPVIVATVTEGDRIAIYASAQCFVGDSSVASSGANLGLTIPATTVIELPASTAKSDLYAVASSSATVTVLSVA